MSRSIQLLLMTTLILSFVRCQTIYTTKGNVIKEIKYKLYVHPQGENVVKMIILHPAPPQESLEWADILIRSIEVSSTYALNVDYLHISIPRQPYGGETYTLHMTNYLNWKNSEIRLESIFSKMKIDQINPIPDHFFH